MTRVWTKAVRGELCSMNCRWSGGVDWASRVVVMVVNVKARMIFINDCFMAVNWEADRLQIYAQLVGFAKLFFGGLGAAYAKASAAEAYNKWVRAKNKLWLPPVGLLG